MERQENSGSGCDWEVRRKNIPGWCHDRLRSGRFNQVRSSDLSKTESDFTDSSRDFVVESAVQR